MPNVKRRARVNRDIDAHFDYLDKEAGPVVANRFVDNAKETFALLVDNPGIGPPLRVKSKNLEGLRRSMVNGFEKYLIYYLPQPDGVEIVHIRHSARDTWKRLKVNEM